jgi:DNA polymerase III delta prime subunit
MASIDRVLALSMRPKLLEDLVGQDGITSTLQAQFSTGRIPHFYIIHGPVGAGKTTLARILSLALQLDPSEDRLKISERDWQEYKKYDIQEINAANRNGIDDIRSIVEMMKYKPMIPSRAKVVILDEAHQLTTAAQNALITETEDVLHTVYYIFCTSAINKIIPALQRRAYMITPKPLTEDDTLSLLQKAAELIGFDGEVEPIHQALSMNSVTSPGLILQAAEKFFSGIPAYESVFNCESSKVDTMAICRSVATGSWKETSALLKSVTKGDVSMVRNCLLGYLKTVLLKSVGSKAVAIAKAIQNIAESASDENICLPAFLSSVCLGCEHIRFQSASKS